MDQEIQNINTTTLAYMGDAVYEVRVREMLKRARNHRTLSRSKNTDPRTYKVATGFEALIGYLFLAEESDRLDEVIEEAIRIIEEE